MGRVKRIWYLSPMRAAKVQASLRIRAVSPEPSLLTLTSSESRGTFRQKARSLAPLNGWACAVKICHDGMLEDTNSLDRSRYDWKAMRVNINIFICCMWRYLDDGCNARGGLTSALLWPINCICAVLLYEPRHEKTWFCHMQTTTCAYQRLCYSLLR